MSTEKQKLKPWEIEALKAIDIAFDRNGLVKNNLNQEEKNKATSILYNAIDNLKPDLAWPFIKLADLVENNKEKIILYTRAYMVEENIYSIKFLFKHILLNNPQILTDLLS